MVVRVERLTRRYLVTEILRKRLLSVLQHPDAQLSITTYFTDNDDLSQNYNGRMFERFGDGGDRDDVFTAADLVGVQALSVRVSPEAAYAVLHGPPALELADHLSAIPRDVDLGSPQARRQVGAEAAAARAWDRLVQLPGVGWVTASKLLARKRPRLLPVYDQVVKCALGSPGNFWISLHDALATPDVISALKPLHQQAPARVTPLRVLDVAVWMHHHRAHVRGSCTDPGVV